MSRYVNVVIENNTRYTDSFFTYRCHEGLPEIKVGDVVRVPFGRGNKELRAYVFEEVELDESQAEESKGKESKVDIEKIKEIKAIDEDISLTPEIIMTSRWMKMRYGVKYIDAIKCFVPPGKPTKTGKEKRPVENIEKELIEIESLTDDQKHAFAEIKKAIDSCEQRNFLINGVTGSGKTEIYMQAIEHVTKNGRSAIMLVPEIALTKQITERFVGRFGRNKVAIMHSKLTPRERFDEWQRIRSGEANIVIGARLGVFAPLENIGLIIMDEEHEQTYKSDKTPKYDTVDVAMKRVMYHNGVLILGSATPSIVTYQRTREGIFEELKLPNRYNGVELPEIQIVDMRDELRSGNRTMFSHELRESIRENLDRKNQSILFLNRRGYSNFISCRECGEAIKCEDCGISLTYHKSSNALVCHYCGIRKPVPKTCPTCGSKYIKYFGVGTEQVEEYTKSEFPDAEVARLDLDTAKSNREINRIINDFAKGKTDILIGTQLVAKGLDFRNVGLVGVIAADLALNIPDYRSGERTFQLITQVAGRAGRGTEKGRVIVQTYSPDNIAIKAASSYDYEGYFRQEIEFRSLMGYPPFSDLILVEFTSKDDKNALATAEEFKDYIEKMSFTEDQVFSPRVSRTFKGAGNNAYRYYVLIKARRENAVKTSDTSDGEKTKGPPMTKRTMYLAGITRFIDKLVSEKNDCSVVVDVNPYSTI